MDEITTCQSNFDRTHIGYLVRQKKAVRLGTLCLMNKDWPNFIHEHQANENEI